MPFTAVSLFSGCGGFDLGLRQLEHRVIWANDKLESAAQLYQASFPDIEFHHKDIREIKNFPKADLVIGCYPCQGYSLGGAREKDKPENQLYLEFARALTQIEPYFFVAENVKGVQSLFGGYYLEEQKKVFGQAGQHGYEVYPLLLNAKDYGVPQDRKRIFLVGVRRDIHFQFQMAEPTHGPRSLSKQSYVTLQQAIGHLEHWPTNENEVCWQGKYNWYYFSRNRRRDWNEVSFTILANCRHVPLHPSSTPLQFKEKDKWEFVEPQPHYRRLSYKECALLQTIEFREEQVCDGPSQHSLSSQCNQSERITRPDERQNQQRIRDPLKLEKPLCLTRAYELMGNAVPPALSKAVFASLPTPDELTNLLRKKLF